MKRFFAKIRVGAGITLLAGVICVGVLPEARAQQFLEKYAPVLGEMTLLPEKEFEAKTVVHEGVPAGDVALSYHFRLPPDWKQQKDAAMTSYQVSNKVLGEVVRFYGPPQLDARSYFSMQAINLEYAMSANEWLLQYLLSNGYTIQGLKMHSDNRAEALFVKIDNDITYVIRAIAQINGRRVVLAQYVMPADNWDAEKRLQAQVVSTFQLTKPVQEDVEEMIKYHFLDISEFQYPNSWEFKPAPLKNAERITFELLNVASQKVKDYKNYKTLNGRIQIDIISYDVAALPQDEIVTLKKALSKFKLVVGEKLETRSDMNFDKDIMPVPTDVYLATDTESNILKYEYWITPIEAGDYYYFIGLITPSRDEDFFMWARNWQTYKLIIKLFHPLDEGLISR